MSRVSRVNSLPIFTHLYLTLPIPVTHSVNDVKRGINKKLIKDTRVMELRREALNSAKLKMHFEDNPQELKMLQHAVSKRLIRPQAHLKDIPDYLIPDALKPKVTVKETSRSHSE